MGMRRQTYCQIWMMLDDVTKTWKDKNALHVESYACMLPTTKSVGAMHESTENKSSATESSGMKTYLADAGGCTKGRCTRKTKGSEENSGVYQWRLSYALNDDHACYCSICLIRNQKYRQHLLPSCPPSYSPRLSLIPAFPI